MSLSPIKPSKTAFLPDVQRKSLKAAKDEFLRQFIEALPYITAIMDKNKRIVLANNVQLEGEYEFSVEEFFGQEIGEAINCIHYNKPHGACEDTGACKMCGLPNIIIQAENSGKKQSQDTTIRVILPNKTEKTYETHLTAAPFLYDNEKYILLTINDISEKKRKRALERIFFHDILNKTGSLQGIFELLSDESEENKQELIKLSAEIIQDLNEELLLQKNLLAAESGDLAIKTEKLKTLDIIDDSIDQVVKYPESQNIQVLRSPDTIDENFESDPIILKRILINMLKNGIEASHNDQKVTIGCEKKMENLIFWVHNYKYIPFQYQIQIFERTFSTKGEDRGLGTYSMKLLGEKYLNGEVYFATDREKGTTFYFKIPQYKQ